MTPTSTLRRVVPVLLGMCVCGLAVAAAQPAETWRIQRTRAWIAAALEHQLGQVDAPVRDVRGWGPADLDDVTDHVRSVIRLMRVATTTTFVRPADPRRNLPSRPLAYSRRELEALRELARDTALRGDGNQLLRRGAMLHTDIAMLAPPPLDLPGSSSTPMLQQRTVHLSDGRTVALGDTAGHWEMAMCLLDAIAFDERGEKGAPAADPFVRLWYGAVGRFMLLNSRLWLPHFDRALQLFAGDAELLMLTGSLHETLATARIQDAVNGSDLRRPALDPRGRTTFYETGVRSRGDELRIAESSFRRALAVDPDRIEARIRLGRVLALLGRQQDATSELRAGTQAADEQLRYYAWLFLGAVADGEDARRAYEEAARLYPAAQSPRLALGDRAALLSLPNDHTSREDPWWTYHLFSGRNAGAAFDRLHALLKAGDRP